MEQGKVSDKGQVTVYALGYATGNGYARLISQPTLELVKLLRAQGHLVVVEPNNGSEIKYYIRKGEFDFLRDPLLLELLGIPFGIFAALVTAWLQNRLSRRGEKENTSTRKGSGSHMVVRVSETSKRTYRDHAGRRVTEKTVRKVTRLIEQQAEAMNATRSARSPYPEMPFPICLEHTSRIVGWANLKETEKGLLASPAIIEDDETWGRLQRGELRGFSVSGVVRESQCSICGGDYAECNHISGLDYEGRKCVNYIKDVDLIEVSVVEEPVNQHCLVNLRKVDDEEKDG